MVGLSGGVDSAVSAALLQRAGADVVGVFIKTWQPEFVKCTWREERRDAMRVAAHLNIPFITLDLEKEYKGGVVDYMINEYREGRTPNPDVMCNKEVKFGAFLKWAIANGADAVATGHYARISENRLLCGTDPAKDQSYFLWTLTQEQSSKIIFPVGHLLKDEVRKLAKKFELPVATKRDSQGICFLGDIDMKDFLSRYIDTNEGDVLDERGEVIGKHDGAVLYTLGEHWQRPYYVIAKDILKNTIIVSDKPKESSTESSIVALDEINWINGNAPKLKKIKACIRYHGKPIPVEVIGELGSRERIGIKFKNALLIAPGQSVVFYQKDVCLGGGIVV